MYTAILLSTMFILAATTTFATTTSFNIEFRACCQVGSKSENCTVFSDPRELIGVACCGSHVYNTSSMLCCEGNVHIRDRGGVMAHSCCGTQPLRLDQTCCGGVIHNMIAGDCCGTEVYYKRDSSLVCCDQVLSVKTTPDDVCCGNSTFDGGLRQQCCGGSIFESAQFDSCCRSNNATLHPYHSSSHVCCDGPLEKTSTSRACCYLRMENGKFVDTQYDKTKQCCKYPYDKIYPMGKNKTC